MAEKITHARREPLFRMARRNDIPKHTALIIRLTAALVSLIVCALIIVLITGENPLKVYLGIIDGALGTSRRFWVTVRDCLTLLIIAVGLTPAFKMRFWNIGAEGQLLMGGTAAAALMIYMGDSMSGGLLLALILVASVTAGMLWGLLPAIFKARFQTNETLFTLMLNYVAMQIVTFCIVYWKTPPGPIPSASSIRAGSRGGFPSCSD